MVMNLSETVNWPKAARELSTILPLEDLYPEVVDFLLQNTSMPWAVSCSGGSDSLALLLLICGHFPEKKEGLYVFHYNHKLRGHESDSEASFVQSCAQSLGLPFILGEGCASIKTRSEASLRKNRHQFFSQSLKKIDSHILLLGHQRNDVAETMLMRLARGSGTSGLCAPRPIHHFKNGKIHLRPLISIGKERLLTALEQIGLPWCNDSSNEGEYYFRNRIRRNVIPDWLSASTTDLWKGIERSRSLLEEDDIALENWLDIIFRDSPIRSGSPLKLQLLTGLPKALFRRALHKWLLLNGISKHFSATSFSSLLDGTRNSESMKINVGKRLFLIFSDKILSLKTIESESSSFFSETPLETGSFIRISPDKLLWAEEVPITSQLKQQIFMGKINPSHEVYLNYDRKENLSFHVRLWIPGDRYKPLGAPGTRKLHDMFIDKKISLSDRPLLPIVYEINKGIAWCPGLPIAEPFKIEDNTQCALKLTFGCNSIKK